VTSAEAWTSLHSPPFRATPLDLKAIADTYFLQGINQLIGHGWPYTPPQVGEPGWSFYAAGAFNEHNPWWLVMPDLMSYLQRVSYLLRAGKPANDVAILLPTEDAQAHFSPGHVSVTEELRTRLGGELIPQILDSGYGFDFIDTEAIKQVGIPFAALVLPEMERIPVDAYRKIQEYQRRGGIVIAVKALPSRAPGVLESVRDSVDVQRLSTQLLGAGRGRATLVADAQQLGPALRARLQPDVSFAPATPEVGFIHRRVPDADTYFIANTDNQPHTFKATFRNTRRHAQWWNPYDGSSSDAGRGNTLTMTLAPYESRVLVFSNETVNAESQVARPFSAMDLVHDWQVSFDKTGVSEPMQSLRSWSDDDATKFYSGSVTYLRSVDIPESLLSSGVVMLDFGAGTVVERPTGPRRFSSRAWLESPVREAAVVYVNGIRAGSVWHPPYTLNLRPLLRAGANQLKIVVGNSAINELSGKAAPDYGLLNQRFGERFTLPKTDPLEPLPSGILGSLRLVSAAP
jgi:hypothetical protein